MVIPVIILFPFLGFIPLFYDIQLGRPSSDVFAVDFVTLNFQYAANVANVLV